MLGAPPNHRRVGRPPSLDQLFAPTLSLDDLEEVKALFAGQGAARSACLPR
jgi:hypothetical protein